MTDLLPSLIGIRGAARAGKDTLAALILQRYPKYTRILKFAASLKQALSIVTQIPVGKFETLADKNKHLGELRVPAVEMTRRFEVAVAAVLGREMDEKTVKAVMASVCTKAPNDASAGIKTPLPAASAASAAAAAPAVVPAEEVHINMTAGEALQRLGSQGFRTVAGESVFVDYCMREVAASASGAVIADARFRNETEAIRKRGGIIVQVTRKQVTADSRDTAHQSERDLDGEVADIVVTNDGNLDELITGFTGELARVMFDRAVADAKATDAKATDSARLVDAAAWAAIVNELAGAADHKKATDFELPSDCAVTVEVAKAYAPVPSTDKIDGIKDFWEWMPLEEGVMNGIRCHTAVVNIAKESPNFGKKAAFVWHLGPNYGELSGESLTRGSAT